jgi:hypothetical protein
VQAFCRRLLPPPFVFGKLVPVLPPAARLNCASLPPAAARFLCLRKPAGRRTPHLFCACASLPHAGRRTFFVPAQACRTPDAALFLKRRRPKICRPPHRFFFLHIHLVSKVFGRRRKAHTPKNVSGLGIHGHAGTNVMIYCVNFRSYLNAKKKRM